MLIIYDKTWCLLCQEIEHEIDRLDSCLLQVYNVFVNNDRLIKDYRFELVEDHHSFGSGRYGVRVLLPADISACFPYLNAVLNDPLYDHENGILIGGKNRRRYAFRPHEIQAGVVTDASEAPSIVDEIVRLVNRVWEERSEITPTTREHRLPAVFSVYQLLPKTNCRECGYLTCLACANDIRNGVISLEKCPLLLKPEYMKNKERLMSMFSSGD
jgi:ArsR family metal-binding transcriptional regulator